MMYLWAAGAMATVKIPVMVEETSGELGVSCSGYDFVLFFGGGDSVEVWKLTELKKDFAKVVRVSRPCEQAYIAHFAFVGWVASK